MFYSIYTFLVEEAFFYVFSFFCIAIIFRLAYFTLHSLQNDPIVLKFFNLKYALRSLINWTIPFKARNMRLNPITFFVSYLFHICIILVPIFYSGHIFILEEYIDLPFEPPMLPDILSDVLTFLALVSGIFLLLRRIIYPPARYVSSSKDFGLLLLVLIPFLTGFLAVRGIGGDFLLFLHVLSAELLLLILPFTRIMHMFLGLFSRSYTGSEFGAIRHAKDW
ncbi:MAG: Uncharacterized protein XD41_1592 [Desulfonauticus sp. 38_4375]|nr:MAG: Uncharacterized protein XD41_1592 [Desulfonauticus sp. 38_4375]